MIKILLLQIGFVAFFGILVSIFANLFVLGLTTAEIFREESLFNFPFFGVEINPIPIGFLIIAFWVVRAIRRVSNIKRWDNPSDIIFFAHNRYIKFPARQSFLAIIASFISLSGGASLGQYGPIVHMGGSFGCFFSNWLRGLNLGRDILIGCGVAAAISAGFNSPIAGIVFAHEAVLRHFSSRALALISVSSLASTALGRYLFVSESLFSLQLDFVVSSEFIFLSLCSGVIFGISAIGFIHLFFVINQFANNSPKNSRYFTIFGFIFLILVSQAYPDALGLGMGVVNDTLNAVQPLNILFIMLLVKLVAVLVSINIGFSGGFFGPALFIGAMIGGIIGHSFSFLDFPFLTTMFVVSGAASVAGTIFGAPLAMVILVLELTGSYDLALSAMLSIIISSLICRLFFAHSFFDLQLLKRKIDIAKGRAFLELETIKVGSIVSSQFLAFEEQECCQFILDKMKENSFTECYCIDSENKFVGKISIFDVIQNPEMSASQIADKNCTKLLDTQSINDAIEVAKSFIGEGIPVIEAESRKLLGTISEADLFNQHSDEIHQTRKIEAS